MGGLVSIEPPEAMEALDTLLGGPQAQVGFVKVTGLDALEPIDPATRTTVYRRALHRVPAETVAARATVPGDGETLRATARWRRTERDPMLAELTRAHLAALGAVPSAADARTDVTGLRERAGILERYTPWLEHALRMMPATAPPLDEVTREWDERRAAWSADPDKKAELALVDATLRALPDILTGRTRPTDVMFPRGSVELVEGCYRNNRVADTYNRAVADAAVAIVAERLRQEPDARLRILEIGAGTGGTSVGMFAALRPFRDRIETYTYTDLSKAFLNRAQATFGPDVPYLDCVRFDAEAPLAGQGIPAGSFDLVIAANVLHATRDTRNTLQNAKAALRDGGWLLLNELAMFDVFSHLTFGLLEGWWLFEDAPLRIPGSPALTPESWRQVLRGEGFPSVVFVLPEAQELGQQIIAAQSDGVARQRVTAKAVAAAKPVVAARPVVQEPVTAPHARAGAGAGAGTGARRPGAAAARRRGPDGDADRLPPGTGRGHAQVPGREDRPGRAARQLRHGLDPRPAAHQRAPRGPRRGLLHAALRGGVRRRALRTLPRNRRRPRGRARGAPGARSGRGPGARGRGHAPGTLHGRPLPVGRADREARPGRRSPDGRRGPAADVRHRRARARDHAAGGRQRRDGTGLPAVPDRAHRRVPVREVRRGTPRQAGRLDGRPARLRHRRAAAAVSGHGGRAAGRHLAAAVRRAGGSRWWRTPRAAGPPTRPYGSWRRSASRPPRWCCSTRPARRVRPCATGWPRSPGN
ncbi:hypothetical protein GCM10020000_12230 [Streptomyces olivoverticillatus]